MVSVDRSPFGAFDPTSIRLANAHSTAVDFAKTGIRVDPDVLQLLKVPEWPDFMERLDSPSYRSRNVLGRLYRDLPRSASEPHVFRDFPDRITFEWSAEIADLIRPLYALYCERIRGLALAFDLEQYHSDLNCHFEAEAGGTLGTRDHTSAALDLAVALSDLEEGILQKFETITRHLVSGKLFPDGASAKRAVAGAAYSICHSQEETPENPDRIFSFGFLLLDDLCALARTTQR